MAPLEPLAGTAEMAPDADRAPRQRSLSLTRTLSHPTSDIGPALLYRTSNATSNASRHTGIHAVTARLGLGGLARRSLGIALLLLVVFLWTVSNFLASFIFADHTYNKPFFLVYFNTSAFAISLIPMLVRFVARHGVEGVRNELRGLLRRAGNERLYGWPAANGSRASIGGGAARRGSLLGRPYAKAPDEEQHGLLNGGDEYDDEHLLDVEEGEAEGSVNSSTFGMVEGRAVDGDYKQGFYATGNDKLSLRETAVLSLEFCMLWFCANYFASACLEYTSVSSVTILTSTSSVWTLVFCAVMRVEAFSYRKLLSVLASLVGVVLISTVDLSGMSDDDRGNFPQKSQASIALGDGMAFFSAIIYGLYVTVMKRRVGDEDRVNMPLFFGLVGVLNLLLLWPGFFLLHWTGIEPFEWPPTGQVWAIIAVSP